MNDTVPTDVETPVAPSAGETSFAPTSKMSTIPRHGTVEVAPPPLQPASADTTKKTGTRWFIDFSMIHENSEC